MKKHNPPIDPWPLLLKRFPNSEYALLSEVRDKAGFYASRAADGIAMNLWPSRGLHINGIEIKSYRSDWLSELKKPAKAENIFKFCDYWWLVAAGEGIVNKEEVPKTWGFLEVQNGKLKTIIEAPKLTPAPLDRHFVAAMLKRATKGMISAESIQDKINEARKQGEEIGKNANKHSNERLTNLQKLILDFEDASGIKIDAWEDPIKIGEAVRFVRGGGTERIRKDLERLKLTADGIADRINQAIESMNELTIEENKTSAV